MSRPARLRPACAGLVLGLLAAPAAGDPAPVEIAPPAWRAAGCVAADTCRIGAARLAAEPRPEAVFIEQRFADIHGLGISATDTGADRDDEIQGAVLDLGAPGERLAVVFDRPHRILRIVLGHLYNPDMPGDPAETAVIEAFRDGESLGQIRLTSVDDDVGAFVVEGSAPVGAVRRLDTRAGQYVLFDPFDAAIDGVVFTAAVVATGDTADYSLVSLAAEPAR